MLWARLWNKYSYSSVHYCTMYKLTFLTCEIHPILATLYLKSFGFA
jgi:hypothetical protein